MLTGGSTFSAAETFTQPSSTTQVGPCGSGSPHKRLLGHATRRLPGGWETWLPNEEFRTRPEGTFDGPSIPPRLKEPVFTDEQFAGHHDSAFDRAVAVLRGHY
ncbi:hypothetical protein [Streptomyces gobiensis]|uniref:hypothetical protein n=1 Tax=Streptomyces gobiensis TaxID=2875706 RepID=UPI001E4B980D|nr:hypothetical protein [Streptomyces gobiensis]UGY90292.1 hypothetical protein test1122_00155 [Streptomyces gobiensis]